MEFYEDMANAFKTLSEQGAFLTVKNQAGKVNTMTISWGYIGFSWNKPHFIAMVRPQRYTHEVLITADSYTISIPYDDSMKKALAICGSQSGRDIDKEQVAGIQFVAAQKVSSPIVANCNMYYECKIDYVDQLHPGNLPANMVVDYYKGDYHGFYYGEIVAAYKK